MKKQLARFGVRLQRSYKSDPGLFVLRVAIIGGLLLVVAITRAFPTPDLLFMSLFVVALTFGQARPFIVRFLPFIALLLVYDSFRGLADDLNKNVHVHELIAFDKWFFAGIIPTQVLQEWWWHGTVSWLDFYFYFLYTIHFAVPVLLAVIIWKLHSRIYWQYVSAFVVLSFAAFITYVLFPAAPPWMASDVGFIEPIEHISSQIWVAMGVNNFSAVYNSLSPNLVAAVPSLHAAFPLMVVMFLVKIFGLKKTWWVFFYPVSVWIGIVYLGEHWVVDVILGISYALAAYFISDIIFELYSLRRKKRKRVIVNRRKK